MKRSRITSDQFRVSKPGFDVDTANPQDMLLHESFFYSQPFLWRYIPCPFSGYTGTEGRDETVAPISFSNPGTLPPSVIVYGVADDGQIRFPGRNSAAVGSAQTGWNTRSFVITANATASNVTVRFIKFANSNLSPSGCYIILFRRAG